MIDLQFVSPKNGAFAIRFSNKVMAGSAFLNPAYFAYYTLCGVLCMHTTPYIVYVANNFCTI